MSFPGELRVLSHIARPDMAVFTNIHAVHLMNFNSIKGISEAKAELLEGVPAEGLVIANADDPEVMRIAGESGRRTITFSTEGDADIASGKVEDLGVEGLNFELVVGGKSLSVRSPLPGIHNLQNLLAALAIGIALEIDPETLLSGIEKLELSSWRSHIVKFSEGWTLFDDAYNSNPEALRRVLTTLVNSRGFKRRVAVLGDMLELGAGEVREHLIMGAQLVGSGIDFLIAVGPLAREMAAGAISAGMNPGSVICVDETKEAIPIILDNVTSGDMVLVKGSRGVKMETIVDELTRRFTPLVDSAVGKREK